MWALVAVLCLCLAVASAADAPDRTYYIGAIEIEWNYIPDGADLQTVHAANAEGTEPEVFLSQGIDRIGPTYIKAVFREYTDATFTTLAAHKQSLGGIGPLIHVVEGENVDVVFKNMLVIPANIVTGAVQVSNEQYFHQVAPGETYTYHWRVVDNNSPGESDTSSLPYLYRSEVDYTFDMFSGLYGIVAVTKKGRARRNGTPNDVQGEFALVYSIVDENFSPYIDMNIKKYVFNADTANLTALKADPGFILSNQMHAMNMLMYGNLKGLDMYQGKLYRWYIATIGGVFDIHLSHWHAQTLLISNHRVDAWSVTPGQVDTLDLFTDNPGKWLMHCHTSDHIDRGMVTTYYVYDRADKPDDPKFDEEQEGYDVEPSVLLDKQLFALEYKFEQSLNAGVRFMFAPLALLCCIVFLF